MPHTGIRFSLSLKQFLFLVVTVISIKQIKTNHPPSPHRITFKGGETDWDGWLNEEGVKETEASSLNVRFLVWKPQEA